MATSAVRVALANGLVIDADALSAQYTESETSVERLLSSVTLPATKRLQDAYLKLLSEPEAAVLAAFTHLCEVTMMQEFYQLQAEGSGDLESAINKDQDAVGCLLEKYSELRVRFAAWAEQQGLSESDYLPDEQEPEEVSTGTVCSRSAAAVAGVSHSDWLHDNAAAIIKEPNGGLGGDATVTLNIGQYFVVSRGVHPSTGRYAEFSLSLSTVPSPPLAPFRRLREDLNPEGLCGGDRGSDGWAYEAVHVGTVEVTIRNCFRGEVESMVTYTVVVM